MLQGDVGEDDVDRRVGERQGAVARYADVLDRRAIGEIAGGLLQHLAADVGRDHPPGEIGQPMGHPAQAAPDLQNRVVRPDRHPAHR
jgi:hypothetical protein